MTSVNKPFQMIKKKEYKYSLKYYLKRFSIMKIIIRKYAAKPPPFYFSINSAKNIHCSA